MKADKSFFLKKKVRIEVCDYTENSATKFAWGNCDM